MNNISWKPILVLCVFIAATVLVLPSVIMYAQKTDAPTMLHSKKINLGLDLQGGMHLVLEVETEKAVENRIELITHELRSYMKKEHIRHKGVNRIEGNKISIKLEGQAHIDNFIKLIDSEFKNLRQVSKDMQGETMTIVLDLPTEETDYIQKMAAEQAIETIRNRIDEFGVNEPDIRKQGDNRIQIQLPGVKDIQRAKSLIGKTAQLEFKLVDETHNINDALKGNVPPGSELMYEYRVDPRTNRQTKIPYLLKKRVQLDGSSLTDARVRVDQQNNKPYVAISFDKKGGRIFANITGENVKKRLAIVLDNKIYSAPVIQSKITGGNAQITGNFTMNEAHDLAIVLRAGALPAPVKIIEERIVGPTLGMDSITKGLKSMCIGGLIVILFMMIYYKGAGAIADVALVFNILLIAAGLIAFQATLTLPGIAGIILTIGMAVDANVLIFERIREEVAIGKTPRAAVSAGFEKATLTILDANVTTLIVAIVLFQFGSGPVKGFAVTLCLGILASLFTALIVSRMIFELFLENREVKSLSI